MSNRPESGVRAVLSSLMETAQGYVDNLSGETERMRQQIANGKIAMQANITRADGVRPILPAYEGPVEAYERAKAAFAQLENGPDFRAAIQAQATLGQAALTVAALRDAHDQQKQAMLDCADWKEQHGERLKTALATKDVGTKPQEVQTAFAQLGTASGLVDQSLDKPDFTEALGRYATLLTRLNTFEEELVKANKPVPGQGVKNAMKDGNLAEKMRDPVFLQETKEWMAKADPTDAEQRKSMVAVIKAMDPADKEARQLAFEQTFQTKVRSEERHYDLMMMNDPKSKDKPPKKIPRLDKLGKPQYLEGKPEKKPLDPLALEKMTEIMAELPPGHMPAGWVLEGQDKPTDPSTHGSYNDATDMAALTFSKEDVKAGGQFTYAGNCAPGDPLYEAPAFDLLVRHECGHKAGLSLKSRSLTSQAGAGGWIDHGDLDTVLGLLATEKNTFVNAIQQLKGTLTESKIMQVVKQSEEAQFDPGAVADALGLDPSQVPADGLLKILGQAVGAGNPAPYILGGSPTVAGGRIYIVGGPDHTWFSFLKSDWDNRVSYYQFATPEEWFAEFYATANNREAKIRSAAKSRSPVAWEWMKTHGCLAFGDA